jgi:hypothetical protein
MIQMNCAPFRRGLSLAREAIESFGMFCAELGKWILENPMQAVKALCIIYGAVLCFVVWSLAVAYLIIATPVAGYFVLAVTLFYLANCIK